MYIFSFPYKIFDVKNSNNNLEIEDELFPIIKNDPEEFINTPKTSSALTPKEAYAIVIGVADYPGADNDLSYTDDDANDVYSMLVNDYNFKPSNIIRLIDSSATKGAISAALDQMASVITPNDIFFFYYSGHGGANVVNGGTFSYSINSPHPYPNYYDNYWSIYHPNAAYMRVHFSVIDVESGWDYVYVGDSDLISDWYYDEFTGYSTNIWSSWIPLLYDNSLVVRFISDSTIWDWGFTVDKYEVELYDGTHYLVPYDSIPNTPSNYYIDTLLDSKLDNIAAGAEKYVVLDACNTGGMIPEVQEIGRYIMTASLGDQLSLESSALQHGVFTNYFLRSYDYAPDSNGDGVISMEEMYSYTYSNTISYSSSVGYTHHPQEYDGISGEAVLYPSLGSLSLIPSGNTFSYSFDLYGAGLIEELFIVVANVSENFISKIEDLTLNSPTPTGFGSYSGTIQLDGVLGIDSWGFFAKIRGNRVIYFNQSVSQDSDGDLIEDITEILYGLDPSQIDTDSDGLDDHYEFYGVTDPLLYDTESDGMDDYYEVMNDLNPLIDDSRMDNDYDGLLNLVEYQLGSQANNSDSDSDNIPDGWEHNNNLNLLINDASLDPDLDDLSNYQEYTLNLNPQNPDTDNDGLSDGDEVLIHHTDPLIKDTDGDGFSDGLEVLWYSDPLNSKITIITQIFTISGLIMLGGSGFTVVRTKIIERKHINRENKDKFKKFKIDKNIKVFNSLTVKKTVKPKPIVKRPLYQQPPQLLNYRQPSYYPNSNRQSIDLNRIKDIIQYGIPPPKSRNSVEGRRGTLAANIGFKLLNQGKYTESLEYMVNALMLGVPEPMNTRIKNIILDAINRISNLPSSNPFGTSNFSNIANMKKCPICGTQNQLTYKFCLECGRTL